ncbi:FAD/NAD(P)-binding domain-containing protein [Lophiostoma macrostomum CBS 122681]|uniref:FAD/NAD(P)-binding domain-containing protein n=1 Tax=Lophiostoma macrostomum CBS 122681 TaxID=1314788 RepID=A0A6A6T1W4_9PLEO|nr:FAD/NAD(P)-binding domain-containing protein [Lophiostoma macrostomum CBS 122681]
MSAPPPKSYNLAIIGGGIAGCLLSIGLTARHIPHTLYESASQFGEIGAGVGFDAHKVRTMALIAPEVRDAFLRCSEPPSDENPVWFTVRVGDMRRAGSDGVVSIGGELGRKVLAGEPVFNVPSRPGPRGGVHRAHLLDELVKLIPAHVPKFQKKVVDVTEANDRSGDVVVSFADGSSARHAAVLGCDGIKSRTREIVLGKEEAKPVFSGKYAYRGLIPMVKAVQLEGVGKESKVGSQMYMGYHGHVLTFPIAKSSIFNVVAFSSKESWTNAEWVVANSREDMLADFDTWCPTVKAIISEMQTLDIWALFHHPVTRTFYQSTPKICLVGDAAHATTPHHGSGAGMCVEDSYILSELLAETDSAGDLEKAFRTYDEVRRPRTSELVRTSQEGGMLYDFEGPEGDDLEAIAHSMKERMGWIWDYDEGLAEDLERARSILRQV